MFLKQVFTALQEATAEAFGKSTDRKIKETAVRIEYQQDIQEMPSCFIDFNLSRQLEPSGLNNERFATKADTGETYPVQTWRMAGDIVLSPRAAARAHAIILFDHLLADLCFSNAGNGAMRRVLDDHPSIAMTLQWDRVSVQTPQPIMTTEFGTDEMFWEGSITIGMVGEFSADPERSVLVPLDEINTAQYVPPIEDDPIPSLQGWQ